MKSIKGMRDAMRDKIKGGKSASEINKQGAAGPIRGYNVTDKNGNPAGGEIEGIGFHIEWQDGPLRDNGSVKEASGAFVEDVLEAVLERVEYYQNSKYACRENRKIISRIEEALHWCEHRTKDRKQRGVEGKHKI